MSNKKPRLALCCVMLMTICSLVSLGISEKASAIPGDSYEPDDTYLLASEILSGSPQNHNINESGTDIDWVYFILTQESSIVLETSGSSGDTLLYLYNTSGVPTTYITYNDDSGPGLFSRITRTNLPPDTYYAKVQEYGMNSEISSYDITLTILHDDIYEPDDTYTQASEIFSGINQTHNINDGGADVDWVLFTLSLTSNVTLATSGQSGDTQMYLYNSTGVPSSYIAYNDDGGVGAFSRIFRSNLPPDIYYVRVREYGSNSEIASYNISLTVEPTSTPPPQILGMDLVPFLAILIILIIVIFWKKTERQMPPYASTGVVYTPPNVGQQPAQPEYSSYTSQPSSPTESFCPYCGNRIESSWTVCNSCRAPLGRRY